MTAPARILIIEDDRDLAELARLELKEQGYRVDVEGSARTGGARALGEHWDLLILDLNLGEADGLDICRSLRRRENYVPILMLTARSSEVDRVVGLEMGADDYLVKPVSMRELVARVRAHLRRVDLLRRDSEPEPVRVERGALLIDVHRRRVELSSRPLELTPKEFDLLMHFATRPGVVRTRTQLLEDVWGHAYEGYEHTVNTHINRLRNKLVRCDPETEWIETVWGVGYRFREEVGV